MGSAYSRTALRTRLHALIYNQGLPSIFLTLNPADIHSPIVLYYRWHSKLISITFRYNRC